MSTNSPEGPRPLPERPNLRHLKNQAKDLLKAGDAASVSEAQFKIARLYGYIFRCLHCNNIAPTSTRPERTSAWAIMAF
jgi:hypothetical protein